MNIKGLCTQIHVFNKYSQFNIRMRGHARDKLLYQNLVYLTLINTKRNQL